MRPSGFILALLVIFSCKKEQTTLPPLNPAQHKVLVLNEGNFNWGNASLGFYNTEENQYEADVFKRANNHIMGDVFQSMISWEGRYYLVMNNSGLIWAIDTGTFQISGKIEGIHSPRHMVVLAADKAYVTDLYAGSISIVNPSNYTVTGKIDLPGWTEQLLATEHGVLVVNYHSQSLYRINPSTDQVEDSLAIGFYGMEIERMGNSAFMLSEGSPDRGVPGFIAEVDIENFKLKEKWELPAIRGLARAMVVDSTARRVYFLLGGIKYLDLSHRTVKEHGTRQGNLYGLGRHPNTGQLWVSDVQDYVARSKVYILDKNGNDSLSFTAGSICSGFFFPHP